MIRPTRSDDRVMPPETGDQCQHGQTPFRQRAGGDSLPQRWWVSRTSLTILRTAWQGHCWLPSPCRGWRERKREAVRRPPDLVSQSCRSMFTRVEMTRSTHPIEHEIQNQVLFILHKRLGVGGILYFFLRTTEDLSYAGETRESDATRVSAGLPNCILARAPLVAAAERSGGTDRVTLPWRSLVEIAQPRSSRATNRR